MLFLHALSRLSADNGETRSAVPFSHHVDSDARRHIPRPCITYVCTYYVLYAICTIYVRTLRHVAAAVGLQLHIPWVAAEYATTSLTQQGWTLP